MTDQKKRAGGVALKGSLWELQAAPMDEMMKGVPRAAPSPARVAAAKRAGEEAAKSSPFGSKIPADLLLRPLR